MALAAEHRPFNGPMSPNHYDIPPYGSEYPVGISYTAPPRRTSAADPRVGHPLPPNPQSTYTGGIPVEPSVGSSRMHYSTSWRSQPDRLQRDIAGPSDPPRYESNGFQFQKQQQFKPPYQPHRADQSYKSSSEARLGEVCRDWQSGRCEWGTRCRKYHPVLPASTQSQTPSHPPIIARTDQWSASTSTRGSKQQYHSSKYQSPRIEAKVTPSMTAGGFEVIPPEFCRQYRCTGQCDRSQGVCKYIHVPPGQPLPSTDFNTNVRSEDQLRRVFEVRPMIRNPLPPNPVHHTSRPPSWTEFHPAPVAPPRPPPQSVFPQYFQNISTPSYDTIPADRPRLLLPQQSPQQPFLPQYLRSPSQDPTSSPVSSTPLFQPAPNRPIAFAPGPPSTSPNLPLSPALSPPFTESEHASSIPLGSAADTSIITQPQSRSVRSSLPNVLLPLLQPTPKSIPQNAVLQSLSPLVRLPPVALPSLTKPRVPSFLTPSQVYSSTSVASQSTSDVPQDLPVQQPASPFKQDLGRREAAEDVLPTDTPPAQPPSAKPSPSSETTVTSPFHPIRTIAVATDVPQISTAKAAAADTPGSRTSPVVPTAPAAVRVLGSVSPLVVDSDQSSELPKVLPATSVSKAADKAGSTVPQSRVSPVSEVAPVTVAKLAEVVQDARASLLSVAPQKAETPIVPVIVGSNRPISGAAPKAIQKQHSRPVCRDFLRGLCFVRPCMRLHPAEHLSNSDEGRISSGMGKPQGTLTKERKLSPAPSTTKSTKTPSVALTLPATALAAKAIKHSESVAQVLVLESTSPSASEVSPVSEGAAVTAKKVQVVELQNPVGLVSPNQLENGRSTSVVRNNMSGSTQLKAPNEMVNAAVTPSSPLADTREVCRKFLKGFCENPRCSRLHPDDQEAGAAKKNPADTMNTKSLSAVDSRSLQVASAPNKAADNSGTLTVAATEMAASLGSGSKSKAAGEPTRTSSASTRRQLTAEQRDRICRNHLHGFCGYFSYCHRKHVSLSRWQEFYDQEELCPDGPKCGLRRCQFKQQAGLTVANDHSSEGITPSVMERTDPESRPNCVDTKSRTSSDISKPLVNVGVAPGNTPRADTPTQDKPRKKSLGKTESLDSVASASSIASSKMSSDSATSESSSTSVSSAVGSVRNVSTPAGRSKQKLPQVGNSTKTQEDLAKAVSVPVAPSPSPPTPQKLTTGHSNSETKQNQRKKQPTSDVDRLMKKLQNSTAKSSSSVDLEKPLTRKHVRGAPSLPPGLGLVASDPSADPLLLVTLTVLDATRVTFGPGFKIQDLMTGFESRDIVLKAIPVDTSADAIRDVLQRFGEVTSVHIPEYRKEGTMTVKASFANYVDAGVAVSTLDGADVLGGDLDIVLASTSPGKAIVQDGDVCLEFPSPSKVAYAGYASRPKADAAIAKASESAMYGEIYEGLPNLGAVNVRFQGLDPKAQCRDVEKFGKPEGVMLGNFNYRRLETALEQLYDKLESFGDLESLDVLPPPYPRGVVRAWARFSNPKTAERACSEMNFRSQKFIGNAKLSAHHQRTLMYNLPQNIFRALAFDIRYLRYCANTQDYRCNVIIVDKSRYIDAAVVRVKLVAEDHTVLGRLKVAFERILKGNRVMQDGNIVWDPYFTSPGGFDFIAELQRNHLGLVINNDQRRRVLSLFGPPERQQRARQAIIAKVEELRARPYKKFSLKGRLVGLFMSADLAKLQQELGPGNVSLDLSEKTLTVRGNEEAFKVARLAILASRRRHPAEKVLVERACPVCFDEVASPVSLECGHSWCKSCLTDYLMAAVDTRVFPLTCLGDEARCSHRITLKVATEVLSPSQIDAVYQSSFLAHIHAHTSEFRHCPTPDCPQIYRKTPKGTVLRCPSCLVRICTDCNKEHHKGVCRYSESEDMKLFEEWTKNHDVKKCPGCKAPIERSAGCNHMTCARCKTHICWVCTATFSSGDEVYDHMHDMHGGIGL